jgi:hypothetical protein
VVLVVKAGIDARSAGHVDVRWLVMCKLCVLKIRRGGLAVEVGMWKVTWVSRTRRPARRGRG